MEISELSGVRITIQIVVWQQKLDGIMTYIAMLILMAVDGVLSLYEPITLHMFRLIRSRL
ncbi:hypothetical protein VU14_16220 [Aeromonas hydrophila]|nr:hypothetical protein VU14_16220 [Aeromonas hydrophila]